MGPHLVFTCVGSTRAEDEWAPPRSWAYRHTADPELSRVQTPSLQLPLADPVAFLERHEGVLGHNARNVINIAPEVSSPASVMHLRRHASLLHADT